MTEQDDDDFQLPADTLAILNQFREEQEKRAELEASGEADIEEDWQLSQFWYCADTARTLCREAVAALGGGTEGGVGPAGDGAPAAGRIAVLSAPTLMQYFKEMPEVQSGAVSLTLLEYDDRFGIKYPNEFVHYDYNHPHAIPEEIKGAFSVVVADPPFLSTECLLKTAQTVRLLGSPQGSKVILCTGAVMEEMAARLLSARRTSFEPRHEKNLGNDFACFVNYEKTAHLGMVADAKRLTDQL